MNTEHSLNVYRMLLWGFMGVPAIRQYYFYITDASCDRMGAHTWLILYMTIIEVAVIFKLGRGVYQVPMPDHLYYGEQKKDRSLSSGCKVKLTLYDSNVGMHRSVPDRLFCVGSAHCQEERGQLSQEATIGNIKIYIRHTITRN